MTEVFFRLQYYKNKWQLYKVVSLPLLAILFSINVLAQGDVQAGKSFRDCPECPEMIAIPAGTFLIGSPSSENGHSDFEGPQKTVSMQKFAAGKFDVTRGQWSACVLATNRPLVGGCAFSGFADTGRKAWDSNPKASWRNLGFLQDDDHPVVCVTWDDAQDYVKWLSQKTGKNYRLLTESEWEYAARAGTLTPFPWGSVASHEYANYGADSGWTGQVAGRDKWMSTSPVGSFPPNAFGLYDMQGNVLQYIEDCFSINYSQLPENGYAYKLDVKLEMTGRYQFMNGKMSCSSRMVRGGDWGDPPGMIRSAYRNWAPGRGFTLQNYRSGGVGFRVARVL